MSTPEPPQPARPRSLLAYAALAPSSHNTQPWRFRVDGRRIDLYADRTRALPVNDPDDRELVISCGAALMNLRVAAAAAGLALDVRLLPDGADGDRLASAAPGPDEPEHDLAGLLSAIAVRRTWRQRFEARPVTREIEHTLVRTALRESAWLTFLHDAADRQRLGALVADGDARQWADRRWRRELAAWMRPRRRGDGLAVPWLAAPFARAVVRGVNLGGSVAARDRRLVDESPALAVLGTASDGAAERLQAGQALQRVLLEACRAGLQASYLNQPVQVAGLRPTVARLVGHGGHPQLVLRFGYPPGPLPESSRRPVDDILEEP